MWSRATSSSAYLVQTMARTHGWRARAPALLRAFSSFPSHEVVLMPALSPTMEAGTLSRWLKKEGDEIVAGDLIAEVETDKATVDFDATDDCFMAKILVPDGTADVPVGDAVALTVESKEDVAAFANFTLDDLDLAPSSSSPPPSPISSSEESTTSAVPKTSSSPPTPSVVASGERVFASPLAKKLVRESGDTPLDLSKIVGSGPNGRVLRDDVIRALESPEQFAHEGTTSNVTMTSAETYVSPQTPVGNYADQDVGRIRRIIAQSTTASKQNVPHYYLTIELGLDSLLSLRSRLNESNAETKISVNDFIIKASALACKAVPEVNSSWITKEDGSNVIRTYEHVDINVGMSTDIGLISPVVRDAHAIGLTSISSRVRGLAEGARENKLDPSDHDVGTFTVSNLGMFGIKQFTAIISEPQACILAVGTAEDRVVPNEDPSCSEIYKIEKRMNVTLSCDHRVVDGAVGAQWLQAFKGLIEDPIKMLL